MIMQRKVFQTLAAILFLGFSSVIFADVKVKANITGIDNDQGVIRETLYSEAIQDQFPDGKPLE
jgi:hypothetical protein